VIQQTVISHPQYARQHGKKNEEKLAGYFSLHSSHSLSGSVFFSAKVKIVNILGFVGH
jgi:hypothetical protein